MQVNSQLVYAPNQMLQLSFSKYQNGRRAILATSPEDGEPIAKLTVNIPELPLGPGELFIKNWSENEGALETLQAAGLVQPIGTVSAGFCEANLCKWIGPEFKD